MRPQGLFVWRKQERRRRAKMAPHCWATWERARRKGPDCWRAIAILQPASAEDKRARLAHHLPETPPACRSLEAAHPDSPHLERAREEKQSLEEPHLGMALPALEF